MRLGVLDIGSDTGHLLVVDASGGAAPMPAYSHQEPPRLAEHLDVAQSLPLGAARLTRDHLSDGLLGRRVRDADAVPDQIGVRG